MNSIIRDDMHLAAGAHIGVMVIPAALAFAQRDNWTGEQLLKGIAGGYEMAVTLGSAVRHAGSCNPHFRPSGIIGAFGAAATGLAVDTDMSTSAAASALSLAANAGVGLNEWPWAGGTEINIHMGNCSRNGINSFDLAKAGIYSSDTALEGKDGLFAAYGSGPKSAEYFRKWLAAHDLGDGIIGVKFKPFAGCNFIQTPVAVALALAKQVKDSIHCVAKIDIVTTAAAKNYPGCDCTGPFDKVQQTKMSLQYGVSTALLFGRVDEFTYCQYDDKNLLELVGKCTVRTDAIYDEAFSRGHQPCRIEIHTTDGKLYRNSQDDVPWLHEDAVEARFRTEAAAIFDPATIDLIRDECWRLRDAPTCNYLFELLSLFSTKASLAVELSV
jgi:2-methylcitrate dehydratase PrpD